MRDGRGDEVPYWRARLRAYRDAGLWLVRRVARAEREAAEAAGPALDRGLAPALGAVAAFWLATWLPHYLTWPLWPDQDTFAAIAQAWDGGRRPYREIRAYNFPGQTYAFWLLGRSVGWGRPAAFYALDAALLVGLVAALAGWSRAAFGRSTAGLVAALAWLWQYLCLDYGRAAQRDWQAPALVALGLLAAEARPGRAGRVAAGLLLAAGAAFRPHVVLFLPALVSAALGPGRKPDNPDARPTRALIETALALAFGLALAFAPLAASGVLGDFARSVRRVGSGEQGYGQLDAAGAVADARSLLAQPETMLALAGAGALAVFGPPSGRAVGRTWGLAVLGAAWYRALHPADHNYLLLPLILMRSIAIGAGVGWLLGLGRLPAWTRFAAVLGLLGGWLTPGPLPIYCRPGASLDAILGRNTDSPPPGTNMLFAPSAWYAWADYTAALDHVRRTTGPQTRLANLLKRHPFPSFNGQVGRAPVFPAEAGILWIWWGNPDVEDEFVAALEAEPDSVVVWCPDEPHLDFRPDLPLAKLSAAVRRLYRPEARFGHFEVWRRDPGRDAASPGTPAAGPGRPAAGAAGVGNGPGPGPG